MVIAGGEWQVPLIRTAKAMGLFVINSNLYSDSPGFRYADVGLVADVLDLEKNLDFANTNLTAL
jgi:carbamoyl-phosphate synthase large subunit